VNLETYRSAAAPELGPIVSVRRVARRFGGSLSAGAMFVLLVLGWKALRVVRAEDRLDLVVRALVVVAIVAAASWGLRRAFSIVIALHEGGLALHERRGVRSVPWSAFEAVRFVPRRDTAFDRTQYTYVLRESGHDLTLPDDFAEREIVVRSIETALAEELWPRMRADFDDGRDIHFGDVVVGPRGVAHGERSTGWDAVAEIRRERSVIDLIRADGKLALELDLEDVPNPRLFVALVEHRLAKAA
jgi:hypothetical protein